MKRYIALLLLGVIPFIIACASMMHGSKQSVNISSFPNEAKVTITTPDGIQYSYTPSVVELKRKYSEVSIFFEKEGYKPVEVNLNRETDGWIWGNLALGGIIGLVVDFSNGAAYKLTPGEVNAVLEKEGISYDYDSDKLMIVLKEID
ncbi:hypothetical protein GF354_00790 [Candidatus Peregrinibacteria bacterium]|nr:hypothetical protein [Candidatus Peregrinibacteria bacterium]